MKSILRSLAVLTLLVGFSSSAMAQDDANIIRPITKQGSAAFLFTINGLGDFGIGTVPIVDGMSAGFGMKYFISDDMALRILLGFNSQSGETAGTNPVDTGSTAFGLGVGVEYHFRPLYSTSPYVGAQVGFGSTNTDMGTVGGNDNSMSSTMLAVGAFAGFDWFFTRGMAAGAEFSLGFQTHSGESKSGGTTTEHPATTSVALSGGGNVHLVVYF